MKGQEVVLVIEQIKVVEFLHSRCKSTAADVIGNISRNVAIKGEKKPKYIYVDSVKALLMPSLFHEVESTINSIQLPKDDVFEIINTNK